MTLTKADLTPREREIIETCFHEAGHATMAVVLGGVLRSAVVSGGLRKGTIYGLTNVEEMPEGREPEVAYAGPWAQARWRHGRRAGLREVYAILDGTGRKDRNLINAARRPGCGYRHHPGPHSLLAVHRHGGRPAVAHDRRPPRRHLRRAEYPGCRERSRIVIDPVRLCAGLVHDHTTRRLTSPTFVTAPRPVALRCCWWSVRSSWLPRRPRRSPSPSTAPNPREQEHGRG